MMYEGLDELELLFIGLIRGMNIGDALHTKQIKSDRPEVVINFELWALLNHLCKSEPG